MPDSLLLPLEPPFWQWTAAALGLIVGSFANVCIHRLPRGESVVRPPSRCPGCETPIGPLDNIPVVSYVVLRGRCRRCRTRISPRYPAVELANALLYLGVAVTYGPSLRAVATMAFMSAMLVLALIDLEHQILPDRITVPGTAASVLASFLPASPVGPVEAVAAAAGGYAVMALLATVARWHYGEEALGQGDWKMAAMMGAFLGWRALLLGVFLGAVVGSAAGVALIALRGGGGRTKVPFGTFLAVGAMAAVLAGEPVIAWYGGLLRA